MRSQGQILNYLNQGKDGKIFPLSKTLLRSSLKGVLAKNERGYRRTAKKKCFWSLLILLLSVASIRRKLLKTIYTEERSDHTNSESCNVQYSFFANTPFKGTVSVMLIVPLCKVGNVRFSTEPLKPLCVRGVQKLVCALSWDCGEGGRANLPRTASLPHFTYLRQCASTKGFRTYPKQSSGKDLPFIIVNFYLKQD